MPPGRDPPRRPARWGSASSCSRSAPRRQRRAARARAPARSGRKWPFGKSSARKARGAFDGKAVAEFAKRAEFAFAPPLVRVASVHRPEAQALRLGALFAQALLLVGLVLLVVAVEESPLRVAFGGEDVGRDAVEEPAVVADHHDRSRELEQRILERAQRLDVEVVRRLVEHQHVAAGDQRLGEVQAPALAAGQVADQLLLVVALEVEPAEVGARRHDELADDEVVEAARDVLPDGLVVLEVLAALLDERHLGGRADLDAAAVGLLLARDHAKERRLAGAVGSDDADDRAGRNLEAEVVDEEPVAETLADAL